MFSGLYWNQPVCLSVCPFVSMYICVYKMLVSVKALEGVLSRRSSYTPIKRKFSGVYLNRRLSIRLCVRLCTKYLSLFSLPLQNEYFRGYTEISLSVCPCVCVSICVQNTSFCQSAGGDIKSHLVIGLV